MSNLLNGEHQSIDLQ